MSLRPRQIFLLGVIGSLSVAALTGIGALLLGDFNRTVSQLIFTMLSIALFSLTALGAALGLRPGPWKVMSVAAFILSAIGLPLFLLMIWFDRALREWTGSYASLETLAKSMGIVAAWAIALPWVSLLGLTRFENWMRVLRWMAMGIPTILAVLITLAIVTDLAGEEDIWFRAIFIFVILTGLFTVAVPILYRLWGQKQAIETVQLSLQLTCPRCLLEQTVNVGRSRCRQCRLWFEIEIEEPRCPHCQYQLHNLTRPTCPECGTSLSHDEMVHTPESSAAAPPNTENTSLIE